jgi:hypothetical protein
MEQKQYNQKNAIFGKSSLVILCCFVAPMIARADFGDFVVGVAGSIGAVPRQFAEGAAIVRTEIFNPASLASIFNSIQCFFGFNCPVVPAGESNTGNQDVAGDRPPQENARVTPGQTGQAQTETNINQLSQARIDQMTIAQANKPPVTQIINPVREIQTIHTVTNNTNTVIIDQSTKAKVEQLLRQLDSDRPNYSVGQSFSIPANLAAAWGNITGTLARQTDLQAALDAKQSLLIADTDYLAPTTASSTYQPLGSYLSSFTETDPDFTASVAHDITGVNITDWNTAYGWGDHAAANYLTVANASSTYQPIGSYLTSLLGLNTDDLSQGTNNSYSQWSATSTGIYYTAGNVGIGTVAPDAKLDVAGKLAQNGTVIAYLPDQTDFTGTLIFGNGGTNLSRSLEFHGRYNTFVGINSGVSISTGYKNTAVGSNSLNRNNTGDSNTAVGDGALYQNTLGSGNVGIGQNALNSNTSGSNNTVNGTQANLFNSTGGNNTSMGYQAGFGTMYNSFSNNSLFGYQSGYGLSTGSNNILLGYKSGDNLTAGSNNILLGYDIDAPVAVGSNQLSIGNLIYAAGGFGTGTTVGAGNVGIGVATPGAKLSVSGGGAIGSVYATTTVSDGNLVVSGNVGIGTTLPGSALDVKGALRLSGATSGYVGFAPAAIAGSTTYTLPSGDGSGGQVLSTNGSGTLSWATMASAASSVTETWAGNVQQAITNLRNQWAQIIPLVQKLSDVDGTSLSNTELSGSDYVLTGANTTGNLLTNTIAPEVVTYSYFDSIQFKVSNGASTAAAPVQAEIYGDADGYTAALNATTKFTIDPANPIINFKRTDTTKAAAGSSQTVWTMTSAGDLPALSGAAHGTILAQEVGVGSVLAVEKSVNGSFTDTAVLVEGTDYTINSANRKATVITLTSGTGIVSGQSKLRITWIADVAKLESSPNNAILKIKFYLNRTNSGETTPAVQQLTIGTAKYVFLKVAQGGFDMTFEQWKGLSADAAAAALNTMDTAKAASFLNYLVDGSGTSADTNKAALVVENANLTVAKAVSIFDNANLTSTKANAVLVHVNLAADKSQSILREMSNYGKIMDIILVGASDTTVAGDTSVGSNARYNNLIVNNSVTLTLSAAQTNVIIANTLTNSGTVSKTATTNGGGGGLIFIVKNLVNRGSIVTATGYAPSAMAGAAGAMVRIGSDATGQGGNGGSYTYSGGVGNPNGGGAGCGNTNYAGVYVGGTVAYTTWTYDVFYQTLRNATIDWWLQNTAIKTPSSPQAFPAIYGAGGALGNAGGWSGGGGGGEIIVLADAFDNNTGTISVVGKNGGGNGASFCGAGGGGGGIVYGLYRTTLISAGTLAASGGSGGPRYSGWPFGGGGNGATGTAITYSVAGADLAENYPVVEEKDENGGMVAIEAGDVVSVASQTLLSVFGQTNTLGQSTAYSSGLSELYGTESTVSVPSYAVSKTKLPYDRLTLGIVSTNPAIVIGPDNGNAVPIALNGRVPVKIDPNSQPINIGDYVTSSGTSGMAMKATRAGQVIGKALELWMPESGKTTAMVFVNLSWYDPDVYLEDARQLSVKKIETEISATTTTTVETNQEMAADYYIPSLDSLMTDLSLSPVASQNASSTYQIVGADNSAITRVGAFSDLVAGQIRAGKLDTRELTIDGASLSDYIKSFSLFPQMATTTFENGIGSLLAAASSTLIISDDGGINFATTTVEQTTQETSLISKFTVLVKSVLERLGLFVQDGVAKLKELVVDTFTAKKATIDQINIQRMNITDQATGETYCTWIANGEWQKVKGICDEAVAGEDIANQAEKIQDVMVQIQADATKTEGEGANASTTIGAGLDFISDTNASTSIGTDASASAEGLILNDNVEGGFSGAGGADNNDKDADLPAEVKAGQEVKMEIEVSVSTEAQASSSSASEEQNFGDSSLELLN